MAKTDNYGLRALITAISFCDVPGCRCRSNHELLRTKVNKKLQHSHQLSEAAFNTIRVDLDRNPIADRPSTSTGEKRRDDGNFDRIVEEAFKAFRDQEREITLKSSKGCFVGDRVITRREGRPGKKYWVGAAHLRHYAEFLLVLKGLKPCVLFVKYAEENDPLFSTVVIDSLVPIMDRLDLWAYGYRVSFYTGSWVFYDARSPKMSLINNVFLTHHDDPVPDPVVADALGYPISFDNWRSGRFVTIRDATELKALVSRGWPQADSCCVQGMTFACPEGDEDVWTKVLELYHRYEEAARGVGTQLVLFIGDYREMVEWLMENPEMLNGPVEIQSRGGPTLNQIMENLEELNLDGSILKDLVEGLDLEDMDFDELMDVLADASDFENPFSDMEGSGMEDSDIEGLDLDDRL